MFNPDVQYATVDEKYLNSAFRSDPLEIGGRIDVEGALLEFNLGDISGTGFDERFCTGVVWKREECVKTGAVEERGNAKSVGVARGDDWFAGILPLLNEQRDNARIDERLIAREQNNIFDFGLRAEPTAQAAANRGSEALLPFRVFDNDRGCFAQFGFNAI